MPGSEGGVSPCVRIDEQLGKWQGAVDDDDEWLHRKASAPPSSQRGEELANAEGEVNRVSSEAFERLRHRGGNEVVTTESSCTRPLDAMRVAAASAS